MSWAVLLVVVPIAWLLYCVAALASRAVRMARLGISRDRRRVSLAPVILVPTLVFWGVALLVDYFAEPWGKLIVGWFHVALGVAAAASVGRSWWVLRSLERTGPRD